MKEIIEKLVEFHKAFGVPVLDKPQNPPLDRVLLRDKILMEEVGELSVAAINGDLVGVADAIVDSIYVLVGTACEFGLHNHLPELFDEVHRSNMSKLDDNGKPILREDGKVIKSKNFVPPNLEAILKNQKPPKGEIGGS